MWQRLKHFFVPCEENTYKPHFLERLSMGIMFFMVLLTFAMANIQAIVWIGSEWMVSTILPAVIVDLTNEKREARAVGMLRRNDVLDTAATLKAQDMAKYGYFAHYSPGGISPWHWFNEAGYSFAYAGENLAVQFTDSGDVVEAWMESPTHRDNIMNGSYTEIGIGTAKGEYQGVPTVFVVQLFGTPRAQEIEREESVKLPVVTTLGIEPQEEEAPLAFVLEEKTNVLSEQVVQSDISSKNSEDIQNTEILSEIIPTPETNAIEVYEGEGVLYSDLATTSWGAPAIIDVENRTGGGEPQTTVLERTATQPSVWLQFIYALMALLVVIALFLSIVIEVRKQNPIQIAYASGLLALMAVLFYVHTVLTSGVTIA